MRPQSVAPSAGRCKDGLDASGMGAEVRRSLRQYWQESTGSGVEERLDQVSADLPYELQSKMFDQLAAVGIAGAGLAVTLIGSLLRNAPAIVWLPVFLFGLAALFAVSGNSHLIDGLFRRRPTLRRSKLYVAAAVGLIGMAIGSLSMSVYHDGKQGADEAREGRAAAKAGKG
jgi:hypothetical protein